MQNWTKELRFLAAAVAAGILLLFVPFDEGRIAVLRLEQSLRSNPAFLDTVRTACASILANRDNRSERFIAERFSRARSAPPNVCNLKLESEHLNRFRARTHWTYLVELQKETGEIPFRDTVHVEFPAPIALFPLIILCLALIFQVRWLPWTWLFAGYMLLVAGGNPVQTSKLCVDALVNTFTNDQTFWGLFLILFAIALKRSSYAHLHKTPPLLSTTWDRLCTGFTVGAGAIWNPMSYTFFLRLFYPFRMVGDTVFYLLQEQTLLCAASLYLLSIDGSYFKDILNRSILLPRYFTFSVVLFFLGTIFTMRKPSASALNRWPRFWLNITLVIAMEVACRLIPFMGGLNSICRVGLALTLSELRLPSQIDGHQLRRTLFPAVGYLFLASSLPGICHRSGLADLSLALWDPRLHPNSFALFTFISAAMLGILTGSFSLPLISLYEILITSGTSSLTRAALLDGVLAGSLLSPFSVYNLIPAALFDQDVKTIMAIRIRQLRYPFAMAAFVYAVSIFQSVSILRPLIFAFLCLVAVSLQLQRWKWNFPKRLLLRFFPIAPTQQS